MFGDVLSIYLCILLLLLHSHIHVHAGLYIYILDTYRRNDKDARRKTSLTKYLPLTLLQGFEKVIQGLRVRGSWRPNRNCNTSTPTLMAVNVVSFSFSWCSTGGPGVHSAGCWLSLLHLISNFAGFQTPLGFARAPSARCGFSYHHSSITPSPTVTGTRTQLSDFSLDWVI